jgi:hypothetical protein
MQTPSESLTGYWFVFGVGLFAGVAAWLTAATSLIRLVVSGPAPSGVDGGVVGAFIAVSMLATAAGTALRSQAKEIEKLRRRLQ